MQSSIGQNFILFSAILTKGKLGTRRGTWSESNTGHGPCWPGFGAAYALKQCVHAFAPDRGFQNGGSTISFKQHFRHINHINKADRRIASNLLMLPL